MKKLIIAGNILFFLAWPIGGHFAEAISSNQDAAGRGYAEVLGYLFAFAIFNPFIAMWPIFTEKKRKKLTNPFTYLAFLPFTVCCLAILAFGLWLGYEFIL